MNKKQTENEKLAFRAARIIRAVVRIPEGVRMELSIGEREAAIVIPNTVAVTPAQAMELGRRFAYAKLTKKGIRVLFGQALCSWPDMLDPENHRL